MPTEILEVTCSPPSVAERSISEARRLAHEIEALLVDAANDGSSDAYALRIAQGLARSLIDQLAERPASSSRLPSRLDARIARANATHVPGGAGGVSDEENGSPRVA